MHEHRSPLGRNGRYTLKMSWSKHSNVEEIEPPNFSMNESTALSWLGLE
jgi:hypothetical protein